MARGLAVADCRALAEAFKEFGLLVMRDLDLDVDQQLGLARIFGEPVLREKNQQADPKRRTQHVSNVLADGVFGAGELDFHMDQLFWAEPLKALMLYGIEIPSQGGDTKFVDTSKVYERMPEELRTRIDQLHCRHAYTFAGDLAKEWRVKDAATQDMTVDHPIVWREPDGRRVGIWVNKLTTVGVVGMSEAEGAELIKAVRDRLYDDTVTYTHKMAPWRSRAVEQSHVPTRAHAVRRCRASYIAPHNIDVVEHGDRTTCLTQTGLHSLRAPPMASARQRPVV